MSPAQADLLAQLPFTLAVPQYGVAVVHAGGLEATAGGMRRGGGLVFTLRYGPGGRSGVAARAHRLLRVDSAHGAADVAVAHVTGLCRLPPDIRVQAWFRVCR